MANSKKMVLEWLNIRRKFVFPLTQTYANKINSKGTINLNVTATSTTFLGDNTRRKYLLRSEREGIQIAMNTTHNTKYLLDGIFKAEKYKGQAKDFSNTKACQRFIARRYEDTYNSLRKKLLD